MIDHICLSVFINESILEMLWYKYSVKHLQIYADCLKEQFL